MDGILNINKPEGMTSFSIVTKVRQLSRERRVGHAGTLDPAATGVLPICLGQGTRIIQFLLEANKTYRAEIELGVATDTYDATGKITQRGDPSRISQAQLESALASFCGLISQTPPMYSAVKHQGQPLYKLARAGINIERKSRLTRIYHLKLIHWEPPVATVEVECGKGTYIRSLAHDLGQSLGCGAILKSLVRIRHGCFDIKDAVSLPQLEDAFRNHYWQRLVYPIDAVLSHWAAVVVDDDTCRAIINGRPVILKNHNGSDKAGYLKQPPPPEPSYCRVYTPDGCFLGVLRFNPEQGEWQPEKIFPKLAYG